MTTLLRLVDPNIVKPKDRGAFAAGRQAALNGRWYFDNPHRRGHPFGEPSARPQVNSWDQGLRAGLIEKGDWK